MGSRQNLNNFAEMPSTPVAFLVSNLDTIFRTSSSDTLLKEKFGVSSGIFSAIYYVIFILGNPECRIAHLYYTFP